MINFPTKNHQFGDFEMLKIGVLMGKIELNKLFGKRKS